MPKVEGKLKCYSFNKKTLSQMDFLCDCLMLKTQTSLIEFLVNERYKKEVESGKESKTNKGTDSGNM